MYWDWKNQKWTNKPIVPYWRTRATPEQLRQYDALSAAYARIHEDPEYQRLSRIVGQLHWEFHSKYPFTGDTLRSRLRAAKKAREDYQAAFDRTAYERTLAELKRAV